MIIMKILMNEDKIKSEGKYTLKELYDKISDVIYSKGITKKIEKGIYIGNDNKDDFANFGKVILELKNYEWFANYVKEWTWNVDGEQDNIAKFYKLGDVI